MKREGYNTKATCLMFQAHNTFPGAIAGSSGAVSESVCMILCGSQITDDSLSYFFKPGPLSSQQEQALVTIITTTPVKECAAFHVTLVLMKKMKPVIILI